MRELPIPERSLKLLVAHLKKERSSRLLILVKRFCKEVPCIVMRDEMDPEMTTTASSFKSKESTSQWIKKAGTSSSLRNTEVKTIIDICLHHCIVDYEGIKMNCADINQENTLFACGYKDSTICVGTLDIETIEEELIFRNESLCKNIHSKNSYTFQHIPTSTFGSGHCLKGHNDEITGLAFAPSGLLMSCSDDTTVQSWRMSDFERVCVYRDHENQIKDIAVSDNGRYFATASIDCTARLWDFKRRTPLMNFHHLLEVEHLKFDPNSRYLATLSESRIIQLWTIEDGCSVWTIPDPNTPDINCIAISSDGKHITYADEEGYIKVWDLSARKILSQGAAHGKPIYDIAYNADSSTIVSCGGDRLIKLWDTKKSSRPPSLKKKSTWKHDLLTRYLADSFDPHYLKFYKKNFLITINSKLRQTS